MRGGGKLAVFVRRNDGGSKEEEAWDDCDLVFKEGRKGHGVFI